MSYASQDDLKAAYTAAEVAQLAASGRDVDKALADADAEIDSYLGVRYVVPLIGTAPRRIIEAACDIARFRLFGVNSEGEPMERYKLVIAWLKDVSAGRANVDGLTPSPDSTAEPGLGIVAHGQAKSCFDWGGY